ncbi:hypothetical protein F5880DRAFT_1521186 [Lentinula raphanica]|nr:hypothetical protein F5880DRAFT_1521186 [Lentinula raphanica]
MVNNRNNFARKMNQSPSSRDLSPLNIPPKAQFSSTSKSNDPIPPSGTTPSSSAQTGSSTTSASSSLFDHDINTATSAQTSATQHSPGSKPENLFARYQSLKTDGSPVSPELQAHAQLLWQTRQIVDAIRRTCIILEESTKIAAVTGPAIMINDELKKIQSSLHEQKAMHDNQLQLLEQKLSSQLEEAIKGSLRKKALEAVKDQVRQKIVDSVNKELHLQLPTALHVQTNQHHPQMLKISASLHNSEARAANANVRTAQDPLHALWPPSGKKLEVHPKFPSTVRALADLSAKDVDLLLGVYNIVIYDHDGGSVDLADKKNYFLNFIGVRLRIILTPTSKDSTKGYSFVISACQ